MGQTSCHLVFFAFLVSKKGHKDTKNHEEHEARLCNFPFFAPLRERIPKELSKTTKLINRSLLGNLFVIVNHHFQRIGIY